MPTETSLQTKPFSDTHGLLYEEGAPSDSELLLILESFDYLLAEIEEVLGPELWASVSNQLQVNARSVTQLSLAVRREVLVKTATGLYEISDPALRELREKQRIATESLYVALIIGAITVLSLVASLTYPGAQEIGLPNMAAFLVSATTVFAIIAGYRENKVSSEQKSVRDKINSKIRSVHNFQST